MRALVFLVLAALLSAGASACSSADAGVTTSAPAGSDPGMLPTPVDVPTCPIGQMARAGSPTCVAVGPAAVPNGFEAAPDAWGFRAIVPAQKCGPAERASIGARDCTPIDDCNAPFPPPDAKLVVSATELTLPAALAIAGDGDTIAIDEGTYASVVVERDVNLVGRCASKVVFQAAGTTKENGIGVDGGHKVSVKSVTLRGFEFGVWAGGTGTSARVENVVFEKGGAAAWVIQGATLDFTKSLVTSAGMSASALADGVIVARGGHATVTDSEFRGVHVALDSFGPKSEASASRLVISERSPELQSPLVVASEGARLDIEESRLEALNGYVGGAKSLDDRDPKGNTPATLHIAKSEMIRTNPTDPSGFDVFGGSTLELVDSTLAYRARIAISGEEAANVSLVRSVIRPVSKDDAAKGVVGAGVVINDGVHLSLDSSAIVGASQSAILASKGCVIRLAGSLVADTWEFERKDFGKRMGTGQAISLAGDASLELTDSTLANNAGVSIWLGPDGASARLERSAVIDTRGADQARATAGLFAVSGTVDISDSLFHGVPDTAMALGDVTGIVSHTIFSKSSVGYRVTGDTTLVEDADESRTPGTGEVITRKNLLVDVGSVEVAEELALGDCRCSKPAR